MPGVFPTIPAHLSRATRRRRAADHGMRAFAAAHRKVAITVSGPMIRYSSRLSATIHSLLRSRKIVWRQHLRRYRRDVRPGACAVMAADFCRHCPGARNISEGELPVPAAEPTPGAPARSGNAGRDSTSGRLGCHRRFGRLSGLPSTSHG